MSPHRPRRCGSRTFFVDLALLAALVALVGGCPAPPEDDDSAGPDDGSASPPFVQEVEQVVPGPGLPSDVAVQDASNNLDVTDHDGRLFLAFRTAPSHFASEHAHLYVLSTEDEVSWREEGRFHLGTDLREPRLMSWRGDLFLYFAVLGTDPLDFEPVDMRVTRRIAEGEWTAPEPFYGEGFIPWRVRVVEDVPYMLAYVGGENIYDGDREPIEVHWLTTDDGTQWHAVVGDQPVVQVGGGSETDFAFLEDGGVVAVTRNEAGDETGWGSKICRAGADSLGDWTCVGDPRKYDSPLVFRHGGETYLIGRRNVTETGHFDLGLDDLGPEEQTLAYELDYWVQPKRCSLWRVDPDALAVEFVLDLPSKGDTCFPGMVPRGDGRYLVYNYSSPIDGPDVDWVTGQHGETRIYRQLLVFP